MIDYEGDTPVYLQIAGMLERRIHGGEWAPRRRLPSVTGLEQEYGVARQTILKALGVLAGKGLIYTVKNRGSYVRAGADFITPVTADAQTRIINRPATAVEVDELGLQSGGWVTVIDRGDEVEVLPADKVEIRGT